MPRYNSEFPDQRYGADDVPFKIVRSSVPTLYAKDFEKEYKAFKKFRQQEMKSDREECLKIQRKPIIERMRSEGKTWAEIAQFFKHQSKRG